MPEETTQQENTLGARLNWARDTAGLSYSQAAKILHMDRFELIQLETDKCGASDNLLNEMSIVYDVDLQWLKTGIEREVEMPKKQSWVSESDWASLCRLLARGRQDP